jgi:hypothetical protein
LGWLHNTNQMKKFQIHYCYGGRYKGDNKDFRIIEADNEEQALIRFKTQFRYEEIYWVKEYSPKAYLVAWTIVTTAYDEYLAKETKQYTNHFEVFAHIDDAEEKAFAKGKLLAETDNVYTWNCCEIIKSSEAYF